MTGVLFVDDCPDRRQWAEERYDCKGKCLTSCGTAKDAIWWLEHEIGSAPSDTPFWSDVFLDRHLGMGKPSGMEIVKWVEESKPKVGRFVVHSGDYESAHEMVLRLRAAGYEAIMESFMSLVIRHSTDTRQVAGLMTRNDTDTVENDTE